MGYPRERFGEGYQPALPGLDEFSLGAEAVIRKVTSQGPPLRALERHAEASAIQNRVLRAYFKLIEPREPIWAETIDLVTQHKPKFATPIRDNNSVYGNVSWEIPRLVSDAMETTIVTTDDFYMGEYQRYRYYTDELGTAMRYLLHGRHIFEDSKVPNTLLGVTAQGKRGKRHIPEDPLRRRVVEAALDKTRELQVKVVAEPLGGGESEILPGFDFKVPRTDPTPPDYLQERYIDGLYELIRQGDNTHKPIPHPTRIDIEAYLRDMYLNEPPLPPAYTQLRKVNDLLSGRVPLPINGIVFPDTRV